MKKLLFILIALLASGTMAFGLLTSGAWFSDAATSSGFIITSGSLDLQVSGGPLSASNLAPGMDYVEMGAFCSRNTGTVDLKYRGRFESPADLGSSLLDYMTIKVEQGSGNDWSMFSEINGSAVLPPGDLRDYFEFPGQEPGLVNPAIVEGTLDPGGESCYRLSARLDSSTPDEYQGQSIPFVLHIEATQANNPGWQ